MAWWLYVLFGFIAGVLLTIIVEYFIAKRMFE